MAKRRVDELKERLLATFQVEAEEHLQALSASLLTLERELSPEQARELIETTFREVHTLKGAARSVGLKDVERVCQACESVLSRVTRGLLDLTPEMIGRLQDAVDGVARLVTEGGDAATARRLAGALEGEASEPVSDEAEGAEVRESPREKPAEGLGAALPTGDTIRLAAAKLDALLLQGEDLLGAKLAAEDHVREAQVLVHELARCRAGLSRASGPDGAVAVDALVADLRGVEGQGRALLSRLGRDRRTTAGAIDRLLDEARRVRMTPVSTVLDLFPRMVRELARTEGKEVEWVEGGGDLEVDRKVLEAIKDPLIHLVRNAVDHGIESPEERARAGKPSRGRVGVSVSSLEGGRIEISVEDDGRGIDPAGVRQAAVRARILSSEAAGALTDEAALNLVYHSGLSTSPMITDVSGHGLGLAIVRERVERLKGGIRLDSALGVGTTVRMIVPVTIATFRGLLVTAGGEPFLVPVDAVERVLRVDRDRLGVVQGRAATTWNGHPLSVTRLDGLLGLPDTDDGRGAEDKCPCVVVSSGEERLGLLVDAILGDQEVLVKDLGPPLVRVRNIAGAGLLGTGQMMPILRPADLVAGAREEFPRPPASAAADERDRRRPTILVVDDAMTTRTMERNLLEAAGYQVLTAVDGVEAWTALKSETVDLVVSDVDMPRMDGFDLTARIRADQRLADLPVVLVTALESRENQERGIEVGANAYVVKSSFEQSNLLEIIQRLGMRVDS